MSRAERKQRREQERAEAKGRTKQGLCSRCGKGATEHPGGKCPDGAGSFTWAMDRHDMASLVSRLEELEGLKAKRPSLTRDEQTVLDALAELALGSPAQGEAIAFAAASLLLGPSQSRPMVTPQVVAQKTGLPLHHVRSLLDALVQKGMIEHGPRGGPS